MKAPLQQRSFVGWSLYVCGGLLLWSAHFLFGYVLAALACARGFAHLQWSGVGVVTWVMGPVSLAAIAAGSTLLYRALFAARHSAGHATVRFLHFVAGGVATLALWGIGATTVSSALPLQCGP